MHEYARRRSAFLNFLLASSVLISPLESTPSPGSSTLERDPLVTPRAGTEDSSSLESDLPGRVGKTSSVS